MGNPAKKEALKGTVTIFSNSPGVPTGYGQQTEYLAERLKRHKVDVAIQSNYGREGQNGHWDSKYGKVPEFARGYDLYSTDVAHINHTKYVAQHPEQKSAFISLYDVWIFQNPELLKIDNFLAWTPLDHASMPPQVYNFLKNPNVTPIAMSPFGLRQMEERKIEGIYIPHGIDTHIYKPTHTINGINTRKFLDIPDDSFLIMMNSANKANKSIHRKAFAENLLAFKMFRQKYPNSFIYIHTEPTGVFGGFNLLNLAASLGIPQEAILFPQPNDYKAGFAKEQLAALYTAADITLTTSYGEGFGLATIESQACGTPTITSAFAASIDLAGEDSYLIPGQPFWDEAQGAWFSIPVVPAIIEALEQAHNSKTGKKSEISRKFALEFDVEKIWLEKWMPLLKERLN